jgi:hypothetical protein
MQLWHWTTYALNLVEWVFGGIFNVVDWDGDCVGRWDTVLCFDERNTWNDCKRFLGVLDIVQGKKDLTHTSWYTRSNRRGGLHWILDGLDRFYANSHAMKFSFSGECSCGLIHYRF